MKKHKKRILQTGIWKIVLFVIWTILTMTIDVRAAGPSHTPVGFASFNSWFHHFTGVQMPLYTITDWLGLVPICVCLVFGTIGFLQLIQRKSLLRVDHDIIVLGVYYLLVILTYLLFEAFPLNYRPILIDGCLESSYPSSTTLLVLTVMPTLCFQCRRRLKNNKMNHIIITMTRLFSFFMVVGRLLSGVHWFTDIAGAILLSSGLFSLYKASVLLFCTKS